MFMKSHIVLTALFLSIFLSACTNSAIGPWDTNLPDVINTENTIEKPWTNSMEEIIKDWNISNMKNEKKWKIKFHKFIIPSMGIAVYDSNPNNPEIKVEDEQFNSSNDVEIQYYEIETPLPDLVKWNDWFIKMIKKDISTDFEQVIKNQDWKTILDIIKIDTSLDLWDINDIRLEKSDNKYLVNINDLSNIISYELVSDTTSYLFYIYFDKTRSDRYYLVWTFDWCISSPCSNIASIEFLK